MKLTGKDYQNIANQIEVGTGYIEYVKGEEILYLDYTHSESGYSEDDYYNGTGAYVVTDRELNVTAAESFGDDGEPTQTDFSEKELEKYIA